MQAIDEHKVQQNIDQVHDQGQHERSPGPADPAQCAAYRFNYSDTQIGQAAADQIRPGIGHHLGRSRTKQQVQQRTVKNNTEQADE
ncbi:hypothetical protein D3C85_1603900 [compost metagenome]